ncbi:MAG: protein kinase [Gemmatimonadaceae bacterium]|nr:protein kinase [Gloeobacterales cyanobacterium ES-bin-141]
MPSNVDHSSCSLDELRQQEGSLDPGRVAILAGHIATALAQAHRWGLAHGNLDPRTILVVREQEDEWARVWDRGSGGGMTLHAARYSAPERLNTNSSSVSADMYSLGVMLYELCCGHLPVVAATDDLEAWCFAHTRTLPHPLKLVRSEVPDYLAKLIMQCLHKDPLMRPQGMQDFLKALHAGPLPPRQRTNASTARTLRQPALLLAGVLLLLGIGGAIWTTSTSDVPASDRVLLAKAETQATLGSPEYIGAALSKLERIANTSMVIDRVRQRREEWSTDLLSRALRSAGKGDYANAIILASLVPRSAAQYFEAQYHLETWYAGHDSLPMSTGPLTTDGQAPQVSLRLAQPQVPSSASLKVLPPLTRVPSSAARPQILLPPAYAMSTKTLLMPMATSASTGPTAMLKAASVPVLSDPPAAKVTAIPVNAATAPTLKVASLPVSQTSSLSLLKPAPVPLALEKIPTQIGILKSSAVPLEP